MTTKQLIMAAQLVLNGGIAAQLHHAVQAVTLPTSHVLTELFPPLLLWIPPPLSFPCSTPLTKAFSEPKEATWNQLSAGIWKRACFFCCHILFSAGF